VDIAHWNQEVQKKTENEHRLQERNFSMQLGAAYGLAPVRLQTRRKVAVSIALESLPSFLVQSDVRQVFEFQERLLRFRQLEIIFCAIASAPPAERAMSPQKWTRASSFVIPLPTFSLMSLSKSEGYFAAKIRWRKRSWR
jgi:hypothetical protein